MFSVIISLTPSSILRFFPCYHWLGNNRLSTALLSYMIISAMDGRFISVALKKMRLRKGLSLSQLAIRANTSVSALSRYENGWGRFELATLSKICAGMGCEVVVQFKPLPTQLLKTGATQTLKQIKYLFWDQKVSKQHLKENSVWVVERVIEFGTLSDVHALILFYGKQLFLSTVSTCRFQSAKTKQFWQNILEREGVSCTKRSFPREAKFY